MSKRARSTRHSDSELLDRLEQNVRSGNVEQVRTSVREYGVDVDALLGAYGGCPALGVAATQGQIQVMRTLLDELGADVNAMNRRGSTALMLAALTRNAECVEYLLKSQLVDVNHVNQAGCTALMYAVMHVSEEIVHSLLMRGARADVGDAPLLWSLKHCAGSSCPRIAQQLLQAGHADPDARDTEGMSCLIAAASSADVLGMKDLILYGADVNYEWGEGMRTCLTVLGRNDPDALEELLVLFARRISPRQCRVLFTLRQY
ncbi:putative ankyrin repeat protein L93 [Porphyridium purpureum]|uniref:Putative ankyrin repeat protein L93 n=1 Tax=Porphyridium purpureum TaxID=35688 RepID=A0A5J4Z0E7_PORPP|nr:putative ankyrin repeat protein L93 [Porphyridium purpureum]|eukprot:POR5011..scf208_2